MAKLRIAAVADIHYGKHSRGELHDVFADISHQADVLLLCGDLTDHGLSEEPWRSAYTTLLVSWLNEMTAGLRGPR